MTSGFFESTATWVFSVSGGTVEVGDGGTAALLGAQAQRSIMTMPITKTRLSLVKPNSKIVVL